MSMTGTKMVHVPYKGAGASSMAVISGEVHLISISVSVAVNFIKAGRLRALGVTSRERLSILPHVPAIAETLPGYEFQNFYGVLAPAKTPRPIINKLNAEIVRILKLPDVRKQLENEGYIPVGNTPEEFTAHVQARMAEWSKLLRELNVKPEN
jgi:tripartite-type tricarboxylate transporter receptor subunit TctC